MNYYLRAVAAASQPYECNRRHRRWDHFKPPAFFIITVNRHRRSRAAVCIGMPNRINSNALLTVRWSWRMAMGKQETIPIISRVGWGTRPTPIPTRIVDLLLFDWLMFNQRIKISVYTHTQLWNKNNESQVDEHRNDLFKLCQKRDTYDWRSEISATYPMRWMSMSFFIDYKYFHIHLSIDHLFLSRMS